MFEREPDVTEALLGLENVVLTPHLGSATLETREAMGMLCVEALRAVLLEHRAPANALYSEALRCFQRALHIEPRYGLARQALESLRRMLN